MAVIYNRTGCPFDYADCNTQPLRRMTNDNELQTSDSNLSTSQDHFDQSSQDIELTGNRTNVAEREDIPPDGGYGWVCTAACLLINAHTWGVNSVRFNCNV